jgi:hypothetical protein
MAEEDESIHPLERAIILDDENPIMRIDVKKNEFPIENELDEYIYLCSQSLSAISTSIEKSKIAIEILSSSNQTPPHDSQFNTAEYIEYYIENYFIRSSTVYDRCMIFTNRLLNLGIANQSILHELIVSNDHVKNSGLANLLKNVRKKCTEYRVERNSIVHHGRYSDEKFNGVSAMHKSNQLSAKLGKEAPISPRAIEKYTDDIITMRVDEFSDHISSIEEQVSKFYDAALPIYETKKAEIKVRL